MGKGLLYRLQRQRVVGYRVAKALLSGSVNSEPVLLNHEPLSVVKHYDCEVAPARPAAGRPGGGHGYDIGFAGKDIVRTLGESPGKDLNSAWVCEDRRSHGEAR